MLWPDLPSVIAILLQISLDQFCQQDSAGLLILEKQFIDLHKVSLVLVLFDTSANLNPCPVEHLGVVLKYGVE